MKKVSVIIPCRNEVQYIGQCLDSVLKNDYPFHDLEILVIDGMSEDGTREIVRNYFEKHPFIKLLDNPRKITPAALNTGIKHSKGEIIIRMDAHARYPNNYISVLVHYLNELDCDNVGGLWETLPGGEGIIARAIAVATSSPFGIGDAWYRIGTNQIREVDTVPYGCFKRELFDRIGLFDEELIRNQDDEFNARIKKNGGKIFLIPGIKIEYFARDTIRKMIKMFFQFGCYKPLVNIKIGKPATLRQLVPPLFVLYLLSLILILVLKPDIILPALSVLTIYWIISALGSLVYAIKHKKSTFTILLPIIFFLIHSSYGFGYLAGIINFLILKPLSNT
ncbi:MAG: glycosyltransferase family 2 protein [Bacteroidales bacterium]|nr:glycosyltransferase family 2 protein [Bacteroidales bacterium]